MMHTISWETLPNGVILETVDGISESRPTLNGALDSLFGTTALSGGTGGSTSGTGSGTGSTTGTTGTVNAQLKAQLAIASQAMKDKAAALAAGDWAAYGKADARLKAAIDAALKLANK